MLKEMIEMYLTDILFVLYACYISYLITSIIMNHFVLKQNRKIFFLTTLLSTVFSLFLLLDPFEILPREGNGYFLCLLASLIFFFLPCSLGVKDALAKRFYLSLFFYSILFFTTRFSSSLFLFHPIFQDKSLMIAHFVFPGLIFLLVHLTDQMYFYPLEKKYQVESEKNDYFSG